MHFCYVAGRDSIEIAMCDSGWSQNFKLYEESSQSSENIIIYSYLYDQTNQLSSNLFLQNDVDRPNLRLKRTHYIPGNVLLVLYTLK